MGWFADEVFSDHHHHHHHNAERGKGTTLCFICLVAAIIFLYYSLSVAVLPTCHLDRFYVPALNKALNATNPSYFIFFDIKLRNKNQAKGVKYAPINITLYYNGSFSVGNYTVSGFYQGIKKETHREDVVETRGMPWKSAIELVSNGSTASFRVNMFTTVRFKFLGILGGRHKMKVGATVAVDDSGNKVSHHGIKFKSGASSVPDRVWVGVVLSLSAIVISMF